MKQKLRSIKTRHTLLISHFQMCLIFINFSFSAIVVFTKVVFIDINEEKAHSETAAHVWRGRDALAALFTADSSLETVTRIVFCYRLSEKHLSSDLFFSEKLY